jgi:hypothetical protein
MPRKTPILAFLGPFLFRAFSKHFPKRASKIAGSFRFLTFLLALCALSSLTLAQAQQPTSSSATLAPDLILLFETAPFIPDEHEVVDSQDTGLVIDGCQEFYGTDNSMPGSYLREARVLLEGHWHALDTSCRYGGPFDAADVEVSPNPGGVGYRLEGRFSDGAGTYYAAWLVTPTGTARTRIVAGPAAAELFMIDRVIDGAGSAAMQLGVIDRTIDELSSLKRDLEGGTVAAADAEWIREMIALLDMRRRADIER